MLLLKNRKLSKLLKKKKLTLMVRVKICNDCYAHINYHYISSSHTHTYTSCCHWLWKLFLTWENHELYPPFLLSISPFLLHLLSMLCFSIIQLGLSFTMSSLFESMFRWHFVKPFACQGLGGEKQKQKSAAPSSACNPLFSLQKTVSDLVNKTYSFFTFFWRSLTAYRKRIHFFHPLTTIGFQVFSKKKKKHLEVVFIRFSLTWIFLGEKFHFCANWIAFCTVQSSIKCKKPINNVVFKKPFPTKSAKWFGDANSTEVRIELGMWLLFRSHLLGSVKSSCVAIYFW